jgi:hypothetical protein
MLEVSTIVSHELLVALMGGVARKTPSLPA